MIELHIKKPSSEGNGGTSVKTKNEWDEESRAQIVYRSIK